MSGIKKFTRDLSVATPNVFLSEGITPDRHVVAPYLPLIRYDKREEDYKVISAGTPVALDGNGFLLPAGLGVQVQKAIQASTNYNFGSGQTDRLTRYTATDVSEGVKNSLGVQCILNEPVIWSMFTATAYSHAATVNLSVGDGSITLDLAIGAPIGVIQYDAWRQNGAGLGQNPVNFSSINYNMQQSVGIITRTYMEVPLLVDYTAYDAMPFAGAVAFIGAVSGITTTSDAQSNAGTPAALYGVKVDAGSNFVPWVKGLTAGTGDPADERIGKVIRFLKNTDFPRNALDKVKSWPGGNAQSNFGALDKVAGYNTSGLPEKATYAGLTTSTVRMVRINVDFK